MKAIVGADSEQILGASILGFEGREVMSVLEIATLGKLRCAWGDATFAHPTPAESPNELFMAMDSGS